MCRKSDNGLPHGVGVATKAVAILPKSKTRVRLIISHLAQVVADQVLNS